jgi:hypothetical protein
MNTRPTPDTDAENDLQCELAAWELLKEARRERDEAREQGNDMREKWLAKGQCCEYLGAELHEAINQRDRLAEALRECLERLEHHTEFGALVQADMSAMHSSRAVLQSLTPKP